MFCILFQDPITVEVIAFLRNMNKLTSGEDNSVVGVADPVVSTSTSTSEESSSTKKVDEKPASDTTVPDSIVESVVEGPPGRTSATDLSSPDPLNFGRHRRENVSQRQMKIDHPNGNKKKLKKFYTRQNDLIDQFLGADDEERLQVEEDVRVAPKIKFAVNASFTVNFCLFVIQLYAAVSTGSLSVNDPGCEIFSSCELS